MKTRHRIGIIISIGMLMAQVALAGISATYENSGGPGGPGGKSQQIKITLVVTADIPMSATVSGKYWADSVLEGQFGPFTTSDWVKRSDGSREHSFYTTVPANAAVAVHAQID